MKRLFLLLAASSIAASLNAQENSSVIFTAPVKSIQGLGLAHPTGQVGHYRGNPTNSTGRTTLASFSDWFSVYGQNYQTGVSAGYYFAIAPDSNILDNSLTTPAHIFFHGMGNSFDPTDLCYSTLAVVPGTGYPIDQNTAYTVDSFNIDYQYMRNVAPGGAGDSLIIEIVPTSGSTTDDGTYSLSFNPSATLLQVSTDSSARFADAIYHKTNNQVHDSITAPQLQRYAFLLGYGDTAGNTSKTFALSPAINVSAGQRVVSYATIKTGTAYALGTLITAANWMKLFACTPGGASTWLMQTPHNSSTGYPGSYQAGMISSSQIEYGPDDSSFNFSGHRILIPNVAYCGTASTPTGFEAVDQNFHVKWMSTAAVTNVNSAISSVNAVPNPANSQVNISFNMKSAADVTVTLTNTLGQVVAAQNISNVVNGTASFNTSAIASGLYLYTVSANGQRITGRVVVAH